MTAAVVDPLKSGVWPLWRAIWKLFPVMGVIDLRTPGAWSAFGIDHVTGLRRNRSTQAVSDLLAARPLTDVEAMVAIADLNTRRQRQMLTTMVVLYVTVPVTGVATWAELSSDNAFTVLRDNLTFVIELFVIATTGVAYYAASHWRARQMLEVLELVKIERLAALPLVETPEPAPRRRRAAQPAA